VAWSRSNKTVLSVFGLRPRRIGGSEMFIREFSEQLGKKGWKSVVCFLEKPSLEVRDFLVPANVELEEMAGGWTAQSRAALELARLVRKHRPSIVHLHYTGALTPLPRIAKLMGAQRVYFSDHTSMPENYVPRQRPLWKRAMARAICVPLDGVISVSDYGRRNAVRLHSTPPNRVRMVYNGIDVERAAAGRQQREAFRQRFGIGADRFVIVQAGKLMHEKGIQDLLRAASEVIVKEPRVHIVLAGDGPMQGEVERLAGSLGLASHVTFAGLVRDPLGEGLYAAADVACQLSRWEEVFGFTIAEAMASGLPVIGTRVGGIPELIADGVTGFLVDRGDTQAVARRLLELLGDAALRCRMGAAGRKVTEERFNHRTNVTQLLEIYGL